MKRFLFTGTGLALLAIGLTPLGCSNSSDDSKPTVLKEYDPHQPGGKPAPAANPPGSVKLAVATEPIAPNSTAAEKADVVVPFHLWDMPETAAQALGRIGAAAVPELNRALREPDPLVRKRAADILARIGPEAKEAVPVLIQTLDDPDEDVRKAAIRALGEIGPAAKDAVPHLIDALREPGKLNAGR